MKRPATLNPGMPSRPAIIFVCLAVLLCASCDRAPLASPTSPRDPKNYEDATNAAPPGPIDVSAFDSITVSNDETSLVITRPLRSGSNERSDGQPHRVIRLNPGEALAGDGAVFKLMAFGAGFPTNSSLSETSSDYFPLTLFSLDGTPLGKEAEAALGLRKWNLEVYDSQEEKNPALRLFFGDTNHPPGYYRSVGLFDARTKHRLTSGASWSQVGSRIGYLTLRPHLWHPAPMEMVLDVELDGEVTREIEVGTNVRASVPGGEVLLLGIRDGESYSWGTTTSGSRPDVETFKAQLRQNSERPQSQAAIVTAPEDLAVHFEFLNAEKKVITGGGGGSSGGSFRLTGIGTNAAAVKWMRLTVYTNHHRVIIPLPPLPNLPPENQNVRDLLDVHIPYVRARNEYQFREVIGDLTQMEFRYSLTNVMPAASFPAVFTNTTPAEMLGHYRRFLPSGYQFTIDPANNEIRVEQPRWMKAWLRFKQKLGLK